MPGGRTRRSRPRDPPGDHAALRLGLDRRVRAARAARRPIPISARDPRGGLADAPRLPASRRAPQAGLLRDVRPSPRSSASWSARSAGWWATRRSRTPAPAARRADAAGADAGPQAGRPHRPHPDPARRPGHGRCDAGADAHRPGLAPGPVPGRAHAAAGGVLQQAARPGDRGPVPDPGPHARHGRLRDRGHRGAQALGRHAHQAHQPHRRTGGRAAVVKAHPDVAIHAPRSTASSTRRATSCPAWATPATASSAPAAPADARASRRCESCRFAQYRRTWVRVHRRQRLTGDSRTSSNGSQAWSRPGRTMPSVDLRETDSGDRRGRGRRSRNPATARPGAARVCRSCGDDGAAFRPSFPACRCEAARSPSCRPWIVRRDRLVRVLMAEPWAPVVSVVAPPGYGKTILLADWASRERRPVTWLTIDDYDNEPSVFLTYLAAALDRLAPIDPEVGRAIGSSPTRLLATAVPRLAAAVHRIGEPAILILDDVTPARRSDVPRCPRRAHRPPAGRLPDRPGGARRAGPASRQAPRSTGTSSRSARPSSPSTWTRRGDSLPRRGVRSRPTRSACSANGPKAGRRASTWPRWPVPGPPIPAARP